LFAPRLATWAATGGQVLVIGGVVLSEFLEAVNSLGDLVQTELYRVQDPIPPVRGYAADLTDEGADLLLLLPKLLQLLLKGRGVRWCRS
jgi:hypothetical protein